MYQWQWNITTGQTSIGGTYYGDLEEALDQIKRAIYNADLGIQPRPHGGPVRIELYPYPMPS